MIRPRLRRSPAGRLCPNAVLDDGRRFDDVAGGRFAVVTTTDAAPDQRTEVARRGGVLVQARPGTSLHSSPLRRGRATAAIVRPDSTVLRAGRNLSALCAALPASTLDHNDGAPSGQPTPATASPLPPALGKDTRGVSTGP